MFINADNAAKEYDPTTTHIISNSVYRAQKNKLKINEFISIMEVGEVINVSFRIDYLNYIRNSIFRINSTSLVYSSLIMFVKDTDIMSLSYILNQKIKTYFDFTNM